ncbi:cyclopropane-fatty-acyl-phospholipid synthase family protein [Nocardia sp. NPDC019395]|uniref:cyclopropane-fatty-acyl-phospholipid synthase family protein n=1 Tax=Nocardia sp. NPDC019395 TaxID=3154686 RepID=UPI0033E1C596
MTTQLSTHIPSTAIGVDPVPTGLRTAVAATVADSLFRRAVRRLPLRVEYPGGVVLGRDPDDTAAPLMTLHRPADFAARLGTGGLIGFGESYMAGDWSAPDPATVLTVLAADIENLVPVTLQRFRRFYVAKRPGTERNTRTGTRANIARHYDLSNAFFTLFLDETLTYSSALFSTTTPPPRWPDLAGAQHRKMDRILDAARVGPGTRMLEIGTGWGALALRAAERGATVRSVTLSTEQHRLARERIATAGAEDRVQVDLLDYRQLEGEYDAIVSVEMLEAVGYAYLDIYFRTLQRLLAPHGRAALQVITMPHHRMLATRDTYTWIQKYIFPGGFLPSMRLIAETVGDHTDLRLTEGFSMREHYAHTLRLWLEQFTRNTGQAAGPGLDPVFRRMWELYLAYAEAGFRSGYLDVEQFVLTRGDEE